MEGPHLATAPGRSRAGGLAASELCENLGLRRGLGRIFGLSEGRAVYAADGQLSLLEGLKEGANLDKAEKAKREVGKEGPGPAKKNRRLRAVGTVGIADRAALGAVERRRNDPPPQGRCPSAVVRVVNRRLSKAAKPPPLSTAAAVSTACLGRRRLCWYDLDYGEGEIRRYFTYGFRI